MNPILKLFGRKKLKRKTITERELIAIEKMKAAYKKYPHLGERANLPF